MTRSPEGPRSPALLQLLRYVLWPEAFLAGARARHGCPTTVRLAGFGTFVLLVDPAAIQDVFTGDPQVLHSGEGNAFMAETLGPSSLLVLDGEPHARQRRALTPPFHGESMKAHGAAMHDATLERLRGWRAGGVLALEDECREITLQIILRTIFGLAGDEEIERFAPRVRAFMGFAGHPLALLSELVPRRLRPLLWGPFLARLRAVTGPLLELVAERRARGAEGTDVLARLFAMTHEDGAPLSDAELRDHLFTLLIAGHDTTAVALGWAFQDLLRAPAALLRVRAELDEVFGGGAIEPAGLAQLPFLDAVVKESLRLHPVVPFVVRKLRRPFVAGGREYPAGVHLAPCALLAQRDPELWPEPLAFRPERFLDARPDPYRWFPFGGGARRCIGMAFALFEMRVVLATVLSRVDLRAEGAPESVRRHGLLLAPSARGRAVVVGSWRDPSGRSRPGTGPRPRGAPAGASSAFRRT